MKLSATLANANIHTQTHKEVSQSDNKATAGRTFWRSLTTHFWAYTEEAEQTETKSFEGLL
ncbi:hypothetical protein shim_18690 [Shimia sp. SK013]|uniref:hypothetical protein n=1 Tax=Shimia sp. SK013 TaxID=1389006 RepID=UPI0006CC31F7|nr:hypothetical protein [Shimia sp. SK013]KPA21983.1 hypothetical protein shim_18690 [Shimia sp. SK013]